MFPGSKVPTSFLYAAGNQRLTTKEITGGAAFPFRSCFQFITTFCYLSIVEVKKNKKNIFGILPLSI
jgi:hypothetical protein